MKIIITQIGIVVVAIVVIAIVDIAGMGIRRSRSLRVLSEAATWIVWGPSSPRASSSSVVLLMVEDWR